VILERDGGFPPFAQILDQLDRARAALAAGRARRGTAPPRSLSPADASRPPSEGPTRSVSADARERHARFEQLLVRLYTDRGARDRFLRDPPAEGARYGLEGHYLDALARIDRPGLELAAASFARKRRSQAGPAQS
jgi:hypothetical protein